MMPVVDSDRHLLGIIRYETLQQLREQGYSDSGLSAALQTLMALGEVYWLGVGMSLGSSEPDAQMETKL